MRAKAHGGPIDIQGVTIATVDEKVRLQSVETWMDPLEMFRQAAPNGIVNKEIRKAVPGKDLAAQLDDPIETEDVSKDAQNSESVTTTADLKISAVIDSAISALSNLRSELLGSASKDDLKNIITPNLGTSGRTDRDAVTASGSSSAEKIIANAKGDLAPDNAVVTPANSSDTQATHEEMSNVTPAECPFLMNRE